MLKLHFQNCYQHRVDNRLFKPRLHSIYTLYRTVQSFSKLSSRARANNMEKNRTAVNNPVKTFKTMLNQSLCRFDLFVRLKPGNATRYPNNSLVWCHRGDKYTLNENEMLSYLVRMLVKQHGNWILALIRDNGKTIQGMKNDPGRDVVKLYNGVIECNRLFAYPEMLTKVILPLWLK